MVTGILCHDRKAFDQNRFILKPVPSDSWGGNGPLWGFPLIRIIVFWGLPWVPPILGNAKGRSQADTRLQYAGVCRVEGFWFRV